MIHRRAEITVSTKGRGTYDITREVGNHVSVREGLATVFIQHTSASLVICENADPDVRRDLEAFLARLVPDGDPLFIHTAEGETVYRFCGPSGEGKHHHHLVCRECGRAEEVEGRAIERWADDIASKHGYADVDHTVEIFGVCPDCAR